VTDHCLRSQDYVNVIVADKQSHLVYLDMDAAVIHCTEGIGIWDWASTDGGAEPDVVMASAGDILTEEALAAVAILRERLPDLKIRFVNVVDLYRLQPSTEHPHGLSDRDFDSLFTKDKPVILTFTDIPGSSTSSPIAARTTTTFMSADTKRRAISIRRSSSRFATRSIASTSRLMSSTASPVCRPAALISRSGSRHRSSKALITRMPKG